MKCVFIDAQLSIISIKENIMEKNYLWVYYCVHFATTNKQKLKYCMGIKLLVMLFNLPYVFEHYGYKFINNSVKICSSSQTKNEPIEKFWSWLEKMKWKNSMWWA